MVIIVLLLFLIAPNVCAEPVRFAHGRREVPTYTFSRVEDVAPLFKPLENMGHYPYTILDWNSLGTDRGLFPRYPDWKSGLGVWDNGDERQRRNRRDR